MLTLSEVREALEDTTLLPGWRATAWPHEYEGVWVTIQAPSGAETVPLPPQRDLYSLWEWLVWQVGRMRAAELRGAITYGGEQVFNTHGPGVDEPPAIPWGQRGRLSDVSVVAQ